MTAPAPGVEVIEPHDAERSQRRVAGELDRRGIGPGDRVVFCTPSSAALLLCVLGAARRAVVPVLLNATLMAAERAALIADAEPALVVDDPTQLAALLAGPEAELDPAPRVRPMHYTSGTTGRPKGVWSGVLDDAEAHAQLDDEADLWGFGPADTHLVCSPLSHSVSVRLATAALLRGGRVLVMERFDAARVLEVLEELRPTTTFMAPTALGRLLRAGNCPPVLEPLRLLVHAGSPCPAPLKHAALGRVRAGALWEFYGSTEGQFTVCGPEEWQERPGTVGRARPGRRLAVDGDGVVWCHAPSFARFEYWRDPQSTARAWRDGAFTVGDMGRLDDAGYLYLDGRRDDLVISGGVNVYPAEVEAAIGELPGVHDVAVFGVDDEDWGERVCAAVVGDVEEEALRRHAAARLAPYKRPKGYFLVTELPYTATGKLRRRDVAAMLGLVARAGAVGNDQGMTIATINPTTGETERVFAPDTDEALEAKLSSAAAAFDLQRRASFEERGHLARAAADLLDGEVPDIARVLVTEMGKTFGAAKGEVAKCALALRWYAERAAGLLAPEVVGTSGSESSVRYEPMGPVLAVMPWNFPLWQVMRFAAPGLMAGNVGLLKHASNVPQTALLIEDVFRRAGFPAGAFQALLIGSDRVASVIEDDRVRAVTLTGSESAGRSVASIAGRALKKSVLELGGSDPFVVLPSADLERAAAVAVQARVQNNGQSCIAAKRFIVHDAVYDGFAARFVATMGSLVVGDPMEPGTDVGPLATAQGRDDIAGQVDDARERGASVLCGGRSGDGPGFFYEPTVLTGIEPSMRVHHEEVFGPVALLYRATDAAHALRLANASSFGLGASVWTNDDDERSLFVDRLEAGMVFVNAMVASMPELPFGGTKRSGYGRELSVQGLREFCEAKSVFVA